MSFDGHPLVFTSISQTAGRGRLGRRWISRSGNLFMSQLLNPKLPMSDLVFIVAVSVAEALSSVAQGIDIAIKWPNDILVSGAKICGILIEGASSETVVIGIGINLVSAPPADQIMYPAVDLLSLGFRVERETLLKAYLSYFDANIKQCHEQGFQSIRDKWLRYAFNLGKNIKINSGGKILEGIFKGVDEKGFLLLKQDETITRITVGDVFV